MENTELSKELEKEVETLFELIRQAGEYNRLIRRFFIRGINEMLKDKKWNDVEREYLKFIKKNFERML